MSDYQEQNTQFPTHNIGTSGVLHAKSMFDDFLNSIENDLKIKDEKFTNQDKDRLKIKEGLHEDRKWYDEEYPSLVRKIGYFEEAKQAIEDTYERLKHTTAVQPRDFHSSPYHYHPPPAYHPPAPAYHPPAPSTPPYKAVYEVTRPAGSSLHLNLHCVGRLYPYFPDSPADNDGPGNAAGFEFLWTSLPADGELVHHDHRDCSQHNRQRDWQRGHGQCQLQQLGHSHCPGKQRHHRHQLGLPPDTEQWYSDIPPLYQHGLQHRLHKYWSRRIVWFRQFGRDNLRTILLFHIFSLFIRDF